MKNPEYRKKKNAQERIRRKENPERYREYELKKRYGITAEEYERRVLEQGGRCAICLEPPTEQGLCVDHRHEDGTVRGLLCVKCNAGIGFFDDDPERLRQAADYLDRHDP